MDNEADSEIVLKIADKILEKHKIGSWSFDKGFWHKDNWSLLRENVGKLVMPKKGKRNLTEEAEETDKKFKRLKMKHSAIESNINELEHCGLDRCPDRSYDHFKRYVGLAAAAYNLKRIGRKLLLDQKQAA
jgi:transposase, IS5 family